MKKRRITGEDVFIQICILLMIAILLFTMAYPFYHLICYSISDPSKVRTGFMLLPKGLNLDAYISLFKKGGLLMAAGVSVARSICGPILMLAVSSMAAYVLARRNLIGHKFISRLFVFTMYISAGMIPVYRNIYDLHLAHSFWVYVLPGAMDIFSMVLIRTYIEGIPDGLEEAAHVDGSGYFRTYAQIIMPICKPILATVALFSIVAQWNAYTDTMFYNASDPNLHPLSYILMQYMKSSQLSMEAIRVGAGREQRANAQMVKMAITVITIAPIMCVYPLLQKYFVKGIMIGAIKG